MTDTLILLAFLLWGNLLPPLTSMALGDRFARPLDSGLLLPDGMPLFGPHKTVRGVFASLAGTTAIFPLLGLPWTVAATGAALLMAGDLLSSFCKRRLHLKSGESVFGLDQFFEGLLPALYLSHHLHLSFWQLAAALIIFMPTAHAGAWFWKQILSKPPTKNYPRLVRSTVRFREWRSCHQPLARWHAWLNLSTFLCNRVLVSSFFRLTGHYKQGLANALAPELREHTILCPGLPPAFAGFTILFLTDLHLDGLPGITAAILQRLKGRNFDLCLMGGDIRMHTYGAIAPSLRELRRLLAGISAANGIFGVLGNHDCIEMAPDFEEAGMLMLINDSWRLERNGAAIWLVGVDDPHYYRSHDVARAYSRVPVDACSIFLAHSPEAYREAALHRASLYLAGHTHGGQICLPSGRPLFTNSRAPRFTAAGPWHYREMQGYTSRGAGASGAPLRFNCPGEITLLTLRCSGEESVSGQ
jgi:hypothetical protein